MNYVKFERYDAYKDSEVEWLGEVPEHWCSYRIHDCAVPKKNKNIGLQNKNLLTLSYGKIKKKDINTRFGLLPDSFETYQIVYGGNIILRLTDLQNDKKSLRVGLVTQTGIITSAYLCLKFKNMINPFFSYYLLYTYDISKVFYWYGGGLRSTMKFDDIKVLPFLTPPLPEQTAIADYLDTKTAKIDHQIDLLSQTVKQYAKLKQSLINETVTLGLDKTVNMKDSGIEWIGEVPAHWEVKRLKEIGFLYSGLTGKSGEDFTDENKHSAPFITFTNIANNFYLSKKTLKSVVVFPNEKQNVVRKFDMFFLMSSEDYADIGKSSLLIHDISIPTYLNSFCKGFRFTKRYISPLFVNYLLHSSVYRAYLSNEGKGFTRINLKIEKVNNIELILPPLAEQQAIANHLNEKTVQLDRIVENINTQIDKLKKCKRGQI